MSDDIVVKQNVLNVRLVILPREEAGHIDSLLNGSISSGKDPPSEATLQSLLTFAMKTPDRLWHFLLELGHRLHSPSTWTCAIKGLVVFHRLLRSCSSHKSEDQVLQTLCCIHEKRRILSLTPLISFEPTGSDQTSQTREGSSLVRSYAQFLRQRVRCAGRVGIGQWGYRDEYNRDEKDVGGPLRGEYWCVEADESILKQVHELQLLLQLVLNCLPSSEPMAEVRLVKMVLEHVLWDSFDLYGSINYALVELVERFGTMPKRLGMEAMDICRKAGTQSEKLSELYRVYGDAGIGHGVQYPKVAILGENYLKALEACLTDNYSVPLHPPPSPSPSPSFSSSQSFQGNDSRRRHKQPDKDVSVERVIQRMINPSSSSSSPLSSASQQQFDENARLLFGLSSSYPTPTPSHTDTRGLVVYTSPHGFNLGSENHTRAFSTTPQASNDLQTSGLAAPEPQMARGFDQNLLDSLYEAAVAQRQFYTEPKSQVCSFGSDPFAPSNAIPPPPYVQMAHRAQQQMSMLLQQRMMHQHAHYSDLLQRQSGTYSSARGSPMTHASTPLYKSLDGFGVQYGNVFVPYS